MQITKQVTYKQERNVNGTSLPIAEKIFKLHHRMYIIFLLKRILFVSLEQHLHPNAALVQGKNRTMNREVKEMRIG